ncbi:cyclase family protein [Corynebacterium sp. YIM 101645]|uniref:Cyclase family protein n=1 Tax=Corynebacterium lemuris TaxID=1859292 RepID=A0ABT2FUD7_9CORY|nr:cyclase family protein [Corynebacterium lemuris]MCS5478855.1 cyclase family protein [Corynebacterium lemuris]
MTDNIPPFTELLADSPKNWGRWGTDDEIGALNFLGPAEALTGAASIRSGRSFTLGIPIADPVGDPVWPGRRPTQRFNVLDHSHFAAGKGPDIPGGAEYSDDVVVMYLQGTTQFDALGHAWYDGQIYNGYPASSTIGAMEKASILPIAEHGVVGRGVLIDMATHRGKAVLDAGETFTHEDLLAAAAAQGVEIRKRDILLIRTGWIGSYLGGDVEKFHARPFLEPGLTYSPELVDWFVEREIPVLGTDTITNEVTVDPVSHTSLPLHQALMRNLGVLFSEILNLDALAEDCRADGQWSFLYTAAPLKIHGGTGAPVNPVVIK